MKGPLLSSIGFLMTCMLALSFPSCRKDAPAPGSSTTRARPGKAALEVAAKPAAPVEMVLWHSYREGEKKAIEEVAKAFNAGQKRIHLKLMNIPYDAMVDKITIATPRGQGPDLFIFAHNLIGDWVDNYHILEPISQKVDQATLKRFIPRTVKALVYKRSLYGLPMAFKSLALFYDPDVISTPPSTGDELFKAAVAATDTKTGRYGLVYEASMLYFDAPFIHGFGGVILDAAGRPHVADAPVVQALTWVKRLVKAGAVPKGVNSAMVTSLFNEGKAAMVISGPWFLGEIAKEKKFSVAMLPKMKPDSMARPFLGSEAVFMSSYSRHKKEALEVMLYLTSDESAMTRIKIGRQTVANETVYASADVRADHVVSMFRAQAENSVLMPSAPQMQAVWSTMDMAINQAVFGDVDPAAALEKAQKKIESDISKMKGTGRSMH
ncbi:MAG: extracellular solute-binding protein [Deltaproteobacteria bacterium]|nr:extracellular solute-binding protein [Deltaproteobacteria bacterium]